MFSSFGVREGVIYDQLNEKEKRRDPLLEAAKYFERKESILEISLFKNSKSGKLITLNEYIESMGKKQKDIVIDYVKKRIDKNIDWKSHTAPTGEQLFKSKEEYLINEALEFVTTKKKSN